jgi:hypothetical protein
MPRIPLAGRTPLWLIFVGLVVVQLAPILAFRSHESYRYRMRLSGSRCTVEILHIGSPEIYRVTNDSCEKPAVSWRWGGIGAAFGGALTIATLATNALAERRRGASRRGQWLAAIIVGLALGGLTSFAGGLGSSITCRDREGLCGWPFIIFGGIGFMAALIAVGLTLIARQHTSRLTRAAAYGAIPAMVAAFVAFCMLAAILK